MEENIINIDQYDTTKDLPLSSMEQLIFSKDPSEWTVEERKIAKYLGYISKTETQAIAENSRDNEIQKLLEKDFASWTPLEKEKFKILSSMGKTIETEKK